MIYRMTVIYVFFCLNGNVFADNEFSDNATLVEVISLSRAVGHILTAEATSRVIMGYCAKEFTEIELSCNSALEKWMTNNNSILGKARKGHSYIIEVLKNKEGKKSAEKFKRKTQALINTEVDKMLKSIVDTEKSHQKKICYKFMLAIENGKFDVIYQNPGMYYYLDTKM